MPGHDVMGEAMRCEARRGRGWPPSVGDGHLIEEIKQAQPGPSKQASKQRARREGERAGQGRAGQEDEPGEHKTGPGLQ